MLNLGIRTSELDVVRWIHEPDTTDSGVVAAMRLPRNLSVDTLLMDEVAATGCYHKAWTLNSGLDTRELFLRNSACKRVLYLSAPILLPDNIPVEDFVSTGVNSRIHLYHAPDVRDMIRLEAITSYEVAGFRFRYALSIQYADDSVGRGWQVIRPVIVVDRQLLAAVHRNSAVVHLERVFDALWKLVLVGSHDYVHATVLNWFPPVRGLPPSYLAMLSERVHPAELEQWHAGSQAALPDGLVASRPTPGIATLELYSLMVHGRTIARMWDTDERVGARIRELVTEFDGATAALLGAGVFGDAEQTQSAGEYLTTLAGWFLASALPLGTERFTQVFGLLPARYAEPAGRRLAEAHGGMFDFVRFVDEDRFPWQGRLVEVHDVAAEYEKALRRPALREHLQYLTLPSCEAGGKSWMDVLCGSLDGSGRSGLLDALAVAGAGEVPSESYRELVRLSESGGLGALRSICDDHRFDDRSPAGCAQAVLASLVAVVDNMLTEVRHGRCESALSG